MLLSLVSFVDCLLRSLAPLRRVDLEREAELLVLRHHALMGANQGPATVRGQILTPAPIDRLLLPHR
jgi:hypothetical protein